jgi:hypothetical protein
MESMKIREGVEKLAERAIRAIKKVAKQHNGYIDFESNMFEDINGEDVQGFDCDTMEVVTNENRYGLDLVGLIDAILLLECMEEATV